MRFSVSAASATALLAGVAVAEPIAVVTPCPGVTIPGVQPITVTKQYQEVSTCAPTAVCGWGTCTTRYPFETFAYVSTVIPAAWDGKAAQTTTVTTTTQTVTVSRFQSTLTKWVTPAVTPKSGTMVKPTPTPIYLTIAKDFTVPYNKLGPLAIPGYGGSGLCHECDVQADGSRSQVVGVVECRAGPGGSKCMGYDETWISKPAPSTSATTANACATRWVAPSAGTYTFTFPFVAPARTITAGVTTITVGPVPYWHRVTRVCHRAHEVIDFTTTITKTIYWTAPPFRQPPRTSSAVPLPTGSHGFPGWPRPRPGQGGVDGSKGDPYGWADWGSDDVTNPTKPIPDNWEDWVKSSTTTTPFPGATSTQGPIGQSTTSSYDSTTSSSSSSFIGGPIDGSTTSSMTSTSVDSTTTSSMSSTSSFGQGPIDGSTTTSSTSSFGQGPIDGSTTTSSMTSTSVDSTTTSSTSSFGQGPIDGSTTTSSMSTTSSFSSQGPIENTSTTSSVDSTTTSADSTTTSFDSTTTSFDSTTTSVDSTTSSVDTTTSTITSFTTSTSASTTSAPATTTSFVAIPVDPNNFVIGVDSPTKYRKRALRYIKISSGGDAVLTTDKADASTFSLTAEGYLKSGDLFVDSDSSQGWLSFSLTVSINSNISTWSISADGTLGLNAPNLGICVSADNSVFIQFSAQTPFLCIEIVLNAEVPGPTTSSTTAAPTTTPEPTTTEAPATTTTLDPSGDLDADIPAPTPVRRGVQYGGRRFGRRHH